MKDDWRLRGQDKYLKGVELVRRKYRRYGNNPNWDHDHCEFCWVKFSVADSDSLNDGYATLDDYHWICPQCFDDFRDLFEWHVVERNEK